MTKTRRLPTARRLSIGIDVVDVREVQAALDAFGERYTSRVYTPAEVAYASAAPSETARRLGARFAAKEAAIKVLRAGEVGINPRGIEVVRDADGSCELQLDGAALARARRLGVRSLAVSMTHEGDVAAAVVVGECTNPATSGAPKVRRRR